MKKEVFQSRREGGEEGSTSWQIKGEINQGKGTKIEAREKVQGQKSANSPNQITPSCPGKRIWGELSWTNRANPCLADGGEKKGGCQNRGKWRSLTDVGKARRVKVLSSAGGSVRGKLGR